MQQEINDLKGQMSKAFELLASMATLINTLQAPSQGKEVKGVAVKLTDLASVGKEIQSGVQIGKLDTQMIENPQTNEHGLGKGRMEVCVQYREEKVKGKGKQRVHKFAPKASCLPPQVPWTGATSQVPLAQSHQPQRPPQIWPLYPPRQIEQRSLAALPQQHQSIQSKQKHQTNRAMQRAERRCQSFDPIPISYTELLPHLLERNLVSLIPPPPFRPPYLDGFDENATCTYHAGAKGHTVENCIALKKKVQDLIDAKWLDFSAIMGALASMPPNRGGQDQDHEVEEDLVVWNRQ